MTKKTTLELAEEEVNALFATDIQKKVDEEALRLGFDYKIRDNLYALKGEVSGSVFRDSRFKERLEQTLIMEAINGEEPYPSPYGPFHESRLQVGNGLTLLQLRYCKRIHESMTRSGMKIPWSVG